MTKAIRTLAVFLVLALTAPLLGSREAQALPTNKLLKVGIHQEFESMNPLIAQMAASTYIYYLIGHPLSSISADWKWECWLCKTLPTLENGLVKRIQVDGKEKLRVQWELKEGVKWGDGMPVTGHDVMLSWNIGRSPNVSVGEKDVYDKVEKMEVNPKNPRKFTMLFREARYDYYQLGTFYILPRHIEGKVWEKTKGSLGAYEKQTTYSLNPSNPGLYMGPYLVKEIKLGSHLVLVRNPHYYGRKPAIEKIIFKLIRNTQTLEANLLSGTIDMVCELGMTFDQALAFEKRIQRDPALKRKFKVNFREGTVYEHIDLNLRNPLLKDPRVRRALVHAIDRDKLVQALFEGKQQKALHNIHPLDPYFTSDVVKYPHDPGKAKKLLDQAGWKVGGDGIRRKNGKKLSFTLMTTAENKTRELVQVYLQNQWKQVGIDIKIKNEPARVYFGETVRKGKYPSMAMFAWISSPDNPPKSTVHSEEIPTKENGFSGQNSGGYSNKKVDAALDKIKVEFSFEERKKLMKTVQYEYTKDVPVIPLYLRAQIAVTPANMQGFRLSGHQFYSTLSADGWRLK